MQKTILFTFLFSLQLFSLQLFSQNGTLSGTVYDKSTGEPVIGANIILMNSKIGVASDFDGKYLIKNIPVGVYNIRVFNMGYDEEVIPNLEIKDNNIAIVNVKLKSITYQTDEVVVTAKAFQNTESSVLSKRKNNAAIGDGISAEQIKKSTDATSGDALKRITGLQLVDNKFLFIRGVSDRYNQTMINGTSVTSTSADKKSFSFDMLPSNLIDNSNVAKSATPDLPGDFSGGIVQLNTIDFPESKLVKSSYSSAFNAATSQKMIRTSQQNSTDWIGVDKGVRSFPDLNNISSIQSNLKNTWAPTQHVAPLNQSVALSFGDRYEVGEQMLGIVSSVSYRTSYNRNHFNITDIENGSKIRDFAGDVDKFTVLWGGLFDASIKLNEENSISLRNNYFLSGEDQVSFKKGFHQTDGDRKDYALEWNEREMLSSQLTGEHLFDDEAFKLNWQLYNSTSMALMKDRRALEYSRTEGASSEDPFIAKPGERAWSWLNDNVKGIKADLKYSQSNYIFAIPFTNDAINFDNISFKTGFLYDVKNRDYKIRYFQVTDRYLDWSNNSYRIEPVETIYAEDHFGPGKWNLIETSKSSDNYLANQSLSTFYALTDLEWKIFDRKTLFIGGFRFENSKQNVYTTISPDSPTADTATIAQADLLPSFNLTYWLSDFMNFRIAYSNTINRPEFREMSKAVYFDHNKYEWLYGNTELKRAFIRNFDLRWEFYPSAGEIFAVSYFYKNITDAIEEEIIISAGDINRTWFNSPKAENFGLELEFKKSFFNTLSLYGNYTRVISVVDFIQVSGNTINPITHIATRPLQGQSPWMINLGIGYTHPIIKNSINISLNSYGKRLDAVLGFGEENIYEESRTSIDLTYIQPVFDGIEAKFSVRDIGSPNIILTKGGADYRTTRRGATYSLQFSFDILEFSQKIGSSK